MTISSKKLETEIIYPDSDGAPVAESDPTRKYLFYAVDTLSTYFETRKDVYVSGNLFIYYKKGVPSAVLAPDVFVIFGVENKERMSYKAWEENNKLPNFILEITSKTTQENDELDKPVKYAYLGVKEYFQYDPTGDYLKEQLKGSRLIDGRYQPIEIKHLENDIISIPSEVLGLDLRLMDKELRFFEPTTNRKLLSYKEMKLAKQQVELEKQQVELEKQQAELEKQQAQQALLDAIPRMNALGLNPTQIAAALNLPLDLVRENLS